MEMVITPKCPLCGREMIRESASHNSWPYIHMDYTYICCGRRYAFGVPFDRMAGLALWIWHTNPLEGVREALRLGDKTCPFCDLPMILTKIVEGQGGIAVQWKCPRCYYADHYPEGAGVEGSVKGDNPVIRGLGVSNTDRSLTAPPKIHDGGNAHKMCQSLLEWVFTWYKVKLPILDVGCRDMPRRLDFESHLFKEEGLNFMLHRDYLGLDIIQYQIPLTVKSDAHYLPFVDGSIGTIICFESLEHFRDPILAVKEWGRVLRLGGVAAVTTVQGWPYHEEPEDHWRFKPRALEILLESSGLEVITAFPIGGGAGLHSIAIGRKAEGGLKPFDAEELMRNMVNVHQGGAILR